MTGPSDADLETAIKELNEQHGRIKQFQESVESSVGEAVSKNRTVRVTVDMSGAVQKLKLTGERWRDMAAAELASLIVDTITEAQQDVKTRASALAAELMPAKFDLFGITGGSPTSIDELFASALDLTSNPILNVDVPVARTTPDASGTKELS